MLAIKQRLGEMAKDIQGVKVTYVNSNIGGNTKHSRIFISNICCTNRRLRAK